MQELIAKINRLDLGFSPADLIFFVRVQKALEAMMPDSCKTLDEVKDFCRDNIVEAMEEVLRADLKVSAEILGNPQFTKNLADLLTSAMY